MGVLRDDLRGVHEHVDAMVLAQTPSERAAVLESALRKYLGGQRLHCRTHGVTVNFAELVLHLRSTKATPHQVGDVEPADADPRELGRGGDR